MTLLGKILGISRKDKEVAFSQEMYKNLFYRIESSIKIQNPGIDDSMLLSKAEPLYLELCKYINCGCLDKIYAPLKEAANRLSSGR